MCDLFLLKLKAFIEVPIVFWVYCILCIPFAHFGQTAHFPTEIGVTSQVT